MKSYLRAMSQVIPENAPEHCPGTESEAAGKTSACAGCPNQQICASGKPEMFFVLFNHFV